MFMAFEVARDVLAAIDANRLATAAIRVAEPAKRLVREHGIQQNSESPALLEDILKPSASRIGGPQPRVSHRSTTFAGAEENHS
jgi:hypothetical protein